MPDHRAGHVLAARDEAAARSRRVVRAGRPSRARSIEGTIADVALATELDEADEPTVLATVDFDRDEVAGLAAGRHGARPRSIAAGVRWAMSGCTICSNSFNLTGGGNDHDCKRIPASCCAIVAGSLRAAGAGGREIAGLVRAGQIDRAGRSAGPRGGRAGQGRGRTKERWSASGAGLRRSRIADAKLDKRRAQLELAGGRKQAESDVKVRFAKKVAEVAEAELRRAVDSEKRLAQSVSQSELDQLRLVVQKATLEIEAGPARARAGARPRASSRKTTCRSPSTTSSSAASRRRWPASWPKSIATRANGCSPASRSAHPAARSAAGRRAGQRASRQRRPERPPVKLTVELDGKPAEFAGKIVFVSPEIDPVNGQVRIWAEIDNPGLKLRPGLHGSMVIDGGVRQREPRGKPMTLALRSNPAAERALGPADARRSGIAPQSFGGARAIGPSRIPVSLKYFHLARRRIRRADDARRPRRAWRRFARRCEQRFAPRSSARCNCTAFWPRCIANGLVLADAPGQGEQLLVRRDDSGAAPAVERCSSCWRFAFAASIRSGFWIGCIRIRLAVFAGCAWRLALLLALAAVLLVAVEFDTFRPGCPTFSAIVAASNLPWLVLALAVTKILHELGHGAGLPAFRRRMPRDRRDAAGLHAVPVLQRLRFVDAAEQMAADGDRGGGHVRRADPGLGLHVPVVVQRAGHCSTRCA